MNTVVTIDGLAGTGKTSAANLLAERLGYLHFSSGELYRFIGWLCLRSGVDPDSEEGVVAMLSGQELIFQEVGHKLEPFYQAVNIATELSAPEVSDATSRSAKHPRVRELLVEMQHALLEQYDLVAEGRDMGTVIFPEAPLKFFLIVSAEVKVQRRLDQLSVPGMSEGDAKQLKNKMKIEILDRDERDTQRSVSPTLPASDAIILDNSTGKLTELTENMYNMALERGLQVRKSS